MTKSVAEIRSPYVKSRERHQLVEVRLGIREQSEMFVRPATVFGKCESRHSTFLNSERRDSSLPHFPRPSRARQKVTPALFSLPLWPASVRGWGQRSESGGRKGDVDLPVV